VIRWVDSFVAIAIHELALSQGGGAQGLRDPGLLESALARPKQLLSYGKSKPPIPVLASAYAWGLIRDHPFIDGNKRTALLVADAFCTRNGYRLEASELEARVIFEAAGAGEIKESGLAVWFKRYTRKISQ
jgi:death on curing protein